MAVVGGGRRRRRLPCAPRPMSAPPPFPRLRPDAPLPPVARLPRASTGRSVPWWQPWVIGGVWGVSRKGSAGRPRPSSPPQPAGVCGRERGSGRWGGVVPSRGWGRRVCVGGCRGGWMRCGPVLRGIGPYARRFFLGDPPSGSRPHPGASSLLSPLRERRRAARAREGWPGPRRGRASVRRERRRSSSRLSSSVSLARGCPLRRRPAGRRGVRSPMRALPGGREACGKARESAPAPRPPPRTPVSRLRRAARASVGVVWVWVRSGSGLRPPSFPFPPSLQTRSAATRRPSNNGFCRLVFPGRRRCPWLGKRNLSPLPLQASKQAIHYSYFSLASRDLRSDVATR